MRIGIISTLEASPWGGSELLWSLAAARLQQEGHEVHISVRAFSPIRPEIEALQRAGCRVHHRNANAGPSSPPVPVSSRLTVKERLQAALTWAQQPVVPVAQPQPELNDWAAINNWLDLVRPDFVLISQSFFTDGYTIREACTHRQIPFAPLVQSADDHVWQDDALSVAVAAQFEAASVCLFVSEGLISFARRALATPLPRAKVVFNPPNPGIGSGIIPYPASAEPLRLACVARLECSQKGQDILFEVMGAEKWRQRPISVSLFGSGPDEPRLRRLQSLFGADNIEFRGFGTDLAAIWREHHALVLPSRYEGLPLVVVEAMLCGRPCIVTDVMGSAELLREGETGFIAEAATPHYVDAALERAWQNRARWCEMGARAAASIRAQMPPDPVEQLIGEVIRSEERDSVGGRLDSRAFDGGLC